MRSAAEAAAWAGHMAASHKWNKCSRRAHSRRRSTHYHGRTCQYRLHLSEFLGPRPWQQPLAAMVMMSHDHGHDHGHDHSHDHMIHITPPICGSEWSSALLRNTSNDSATMIQKTPNKPSPPHAPRYPESMARWRGIYLPIRPTGFRNEFKNTAEAAPKREYESRGKHAPRLGKTLLL